MASATKRVVAVALSLGLAVSVAGCAGTDIEFNGGIFDAVGLSSIGKKKTEPQLVNRTGIVVPPTTASLPVPGSGQTNNGQPVGVAGAQWPVDQEADKEAKKTALQQQHDAFCEDARRKYDGNIISDLPKGPLGSCEQSIFRSLTGKPMYERKAGQPAN